MKKDAIALVALDLDGTLTQHRSKLEEPNTRVLDALSRGLTQKMLHGALAELRAADAGHRDQTAQAVERLFLRRDSGR